MTDSTDRLFIQLRFANGLRFGPGKAALIEAIAECGSISAAARRLKMSYRRAWNLVDEMNAAASGKLVETRVGGPPDQAATITPQGAQLAARFRELEQAALDVAAPAFAVLAG